MVNKNHVSGFPIWRKNNLGAFLLHQKRAFKNKIKEIMKNSKIHIQNKML